MNPAPSGNYRRLFQNSGYFRVFNAGLGSTAGSAIASICLIWIVWSDTGSALDIGLLGTANLVAAISFSVFGGTLVDRYDRRRLMILSDLSRAAALGLVVVVLLREGFNFPVLLGASFVLGAFSTLFNPAEQSVIPLLVPPELVADANGLVRSSRSTVQFVGASIGGVLIVTLGPVSGVGVNVLTFLLSAALLTGMHVSSPRRAAAESGGGVRAYFADALGRIPLAPEGSRVPPAHALGDVLQFLLHGGRDVPRRSSRPSSFTGPPSSSPASWRSRWRGRPSARSS